MLRVRSFPGHVVTMIPARPDRLGCEGVDLRAAASGDHPRSLLHCAIDLGRDKQAVPVDDVVDVGIVDDVDADLPALLQTQDRARNHVVIAVCLNYLARGQLERHRGDTDCIIDACGLCERLDAPRE